MNLQKNIYKWGGSVCWVTNTYCLFQRTESMSMIYILHQYNFKQI